MRLFAALVPPPDVLERTLRLVEGVGLASDAHAEPGGDGRRRLMRRRRSGPQEPPAPMLDLLPAAAMHLPIATLGNLALADAARLADEMDRQASTWETPRLHLSGAAGRKPESDGSVSIRLAGDLDAVDALTRGVNHAAAALHLFIDRRAFRPHVQVGTVNARSTTDYLEALVDALNGYESTSWWQTTLSLLVPADLGPGQAPFKTFRDIPLGPAVEH